MGVLLNLAYSKARACCAAAGLGQGWMEMGLESVVMVGL